MKPLKVGVVGVGHLGKEHARIYRDLPESELVGISDLDPAKEDKAKELGTAYYKDFRDLIGKVDAVGWPWGHGPARTISLRPGAHGPLSNRRSPSPNAMRPGHGGSMPGRGPKGPSPSCPASTSEGLN